jgi:hypothetical protein
MREPSSQLIAGLIVASRLLRNETRGLTARPRGSWSFELLAPEAERRSAAQTGDVWK